MQIQSWWLKKLDQAAEARRCSSWIYTQWSDLNLLAMTHRSGRLDLGTLVPNLNNRKPKIIWVRGNEEQPPRTALNGELGQL